VPALNAEEEQRISACAHKSHDRYTSGRCARGGESYYCSGLPRGRDIPELLILASDEASYITGVTLPVAGGDLG
jgi:NAD(P)-dependent dehydrogenase (short-subunit alcohol dehydrogenase family)